MQNFQSTRLAGPRWYNCPAGSCEETSSNLPDDLLQVEYAYSDDAKYAYNYKAQSMDSISLTTHSIDLICLQLQEGELVWLSYRWETDIIHNNDT